MQELREVMGSNIQDAMVKELPSLSTQQWKYLKRRAVDQGSQLCQGSAGVT